MKPGHLYKIICDYTLALYKRIPWKNREYAGKAPGTICTFLKQEQDDCYIYYQLLFEDNILYLVICPPWSDIKEYLKEVQ